uniref:Uncharacterized protein n=1 Tax=Arundo donax TaxID=35708 RepID=A0A0A9ELZ4_ARUDO
MWQQCLMIIQKLCHEAVDIQIVLWVLHLMKMIKQKGLAR